MGVNHRRLLLLQVGIVALSVELNDLILATSAVAGAVALFNGTFAGV